MAAARNQPSYNFLTGEPTSPGPLPLRETFRQSQVARADAGNEDLRAQVNTLQYELETLKQERELAALRQERELRDAQNKAEAEYKKAQVCLENLKSIRRVKAYVLQLAESNGKTSASRYDALFKEFQEAQDAALNERQALEKKVRASQDKAQSLQEELDEAQSELSSIGRQSKGQYDELQERYNTLEGSFADLQADLDMKVNALQSVQQNLAKKEDAVEGLENEIMKLKTQSGDADALLVVKRELSDQVAHIKKLEATNREQAAELTKYRKVHKGIEVVEEEKKALEAKLRIMNDLRRELSESQLRRQVLEDERQSWTAYLESEASGNSDLQFDSPEDLARALVRERLEIASLTERLGAIQPELAVKDANIKTLEDEKAALQSELGKLRSSSTTPATTTTGGSDAKARQRLERQRTLAVKEVEYLRAQLKAMDLDEDGETPADTQHTARITELEDLVDKYRGELQKAHADLSAAEKSQLPADDDAASSGDKRRRAPSPSSAATADERLGELRRKNRALQDALSTSQTRAAQLEADSRAQAAQLSQLKASARTRVLELKRNPTATHEALKLSTIRTLREENAALLQPTPATSSTVPAASLQAARDEADELRTAVAEREKRMLRLKQIWSAKSLEFREAVASVLGWKLDFLPNGRVRVTSMFHPGGDAEEGGEANSIVFDGEQGTMKVSGGPESAFAREIADLITFWVEGRKSVPGLLAAMTLEFLERGDAEEGKGDG